MAVLIYTISLLSMLHFLLLIFGFVSSITGIVGVSIHLLYIRSFHNFSNGKFASFSSLLAFGAYRLNFLYHRKQDLIIWLTSWDMYKPLELVFRDVSKWVGTLEAFCFNIFLRMDYSVATAGALRILCADEP